MTEDDFLDVFYKQYYQMAKRRYVIDDICRDLFVHETMTAGSEWLNRNGLLMFEDVIKYEED